MQPNQPTTNYEDFYDANEPDSSDQLRHLYNSLTKLSDEPFFSTKAIHNQPNAVEYRVTGPTGETLILTTKSYADFIRFIAAKSDHPDLDMNMAADFDIAINNPHS